MRAVLKLTHLQSIPTEGAVKEGHQPLTTNPISHAQSIDRLHARHTLLWKSCEDKTPTLAGLRKGAR